MGNGESMETHLFNLKFTAKSLSREAKKSEQSANANKLKCKTAMEKGNMDGARIYAESAIRDKNQALNYLRLSSRIDAVAQRVNTAVKMKTLTKDMSGIVNSMDSVLKSMNVEKISAVMDKFEKQFEDLDLATGVMENSMAQSTAQAMPESQVDSLMQQVADEHGLEFEAGMANVPIKAKPKETEVKSAEKPKVVVDAGAGGAGGGGVAADAEFDPVPELTRAHIEEAMLSARRSVSDADIRKYEMFATSLQQARGFGDFRFGPAPAAGAVPAAADGEGAADDLYS